MKRKPDIWGWRRRGRILEIKINVDRNDVENAVGHLAGIFKSERYKFREKERRKSTNQGREALASRTKAEKEMI